MCPVWVALQKATGCWAYSNPPSDPAGPVLLQSEAAACKLGFQKGLPIPHKHEALLARLSKVSAYLGQLHGVAGPVTIPPRSATCVCPMAGKQMAHVVNNSTWDGDFCIGVCPLLSFSLTNLTTLQYKIATHCNSKQEPRWERQNRGTRPLRGGGRER